MTLVGTMTYEKGTFAFFDGSSSEYRKALKRAGIIAGYKLTSIAANSVELASGTNAAGAQGRFPTPPGGGRALAAFLTGRELLRDALLRRRKCLWFDGERQFAVCAQRPL